MINWYKKAQNMTIRYDGWWILPNGEVEPLVGFITHRGFLIKNCEKKFNFTPQEFKSRDEFFEIIAFKKGAIRAFITSSDKHTLMAEGLSEHLNSKLSILTDLCIENNVPHLLLMYVNNNGELIGEKTIDIDSDKVNLSFSKKPIKYAQIGEWWIDSYGQVMYADGDVGDMNHEAYVIDHVIGKYIYDEFDHGDWKDWEGFKKELAKEELEEQYDEEIASKLLLDPKQVETAYLKKLLEMGMTNEEYMIAEQMGDARKYGMEQLGWIRVAGNNIQTFNLTHDDLKRIADGLYDANDNIEAEDPQFNIEVMSTNAYYTEIPFSVINEGNPSSLRVYQNAYASSLNWYKTAQIWNVEDGEYLEDKIAALYELEFKYSTFKTRRFTGHPKRYENILRGLETRLRDTLEYVKQDLIGVFGQWLSSHALLQPEIWAQKRVESFFEDGISESALKELIYEYVKYAIYSGDNTRVPRNLNYDKFFSDILHQAQKNIANFPVLSSIYSSGLYDHKNVLIDELESEGFEQFGLRYNKKFENMDQAEDYISNLTMNDVDLESLLYLEDIESFTNAAESNGKLEAVIIELYEKLVFPAWFNYWAAMGIEDTRENIQNIYDKLQTIDYADMGNAIAVINIALNAAHQSGDMLQYVNDTNLSLEQFKGFLSEMSASEKVEDWENQLREIGVEV